MVADGDVEVQGTPGELFVLMLHDRIVELEKSVAALSVCELDPRIELLPPQLGSAERDARDAYLRVHCRTELDLHAWASEVLRRLGGLWQGCELELTCCQHFNLDATFVTEALVCFDRRRSVAQTAKAALDAAADALAQMPQPVLACAVRSREWFVESFRAASGKAPYVWSWDAKAGTVVKEALDTFIEDEGWCLLQGWLAHNNEAVEMLHPRGLHAQVQARKLCSLLTRLA